MSHNISHIREEFPRGSVEKRDGSEDHVNQPKSPRQRNIGPRLRDVYFSTARPNTVKR